MKVIRTAQLGQLTLKIVDDYRQVLWRTPLAEEFAFSVMSEPTGGGSTVRLNNATDLRDLALSEGVELLDAVGLDPEGYAAVVLVMNKNRPYANIRSCLLDIIGRNFLIKSDDVTCRFDGSELVFFVISAIIPVIRLYKYTWNVLDDSFIESLVLEDDYPYSD